MRTTILSFFLAAAITAAGQKYVGGDISMLTKYEEAGVVYKDKDGNAVQPLPFFKEQGLNAMRVRLFVDPSQDNDKGPGLRQGVRQAHQGPGHGLHA